MMNAEDTKLVFGLDIGTRSIVGTVGYRIGTDRFVVVAQESIEHTTRAVIDGQIHDIPTVADTIYKVKERLEKRVREPLSDVSIAAAGRVLKTKRVKARYQFSSETKVTEDHIRSLDMMGVEQAYDEIRKEQTDSGKKFFCVGYSIVKYYLNGYPMEMIEMHMANYIEVELIATFLPEEVVDGLYSAVELAGLHAGHDVDKILQIQRRLGHPQEQQLEHAVVHTDAGGIQLHKPAQRRGVAHGAEDELSLKALAVGLHRAAVGAQGVQIAQPLQNVGEVPQRVFGCLGRGVGGAGKGAEGRHIRKVPVVVPTHVQRVRRTADGGAGGLVHGGGEMQAGGEVVGAAAGQIAQQGLFRLY